MADLDKWFSYDAVEGDFDVHDTEQAARDAVTEWLEHHRDEASTEFGWPEGVESCCWGRITGGVTKLSEKKAHEGAPWDYETDYGLHYSRA